MILHKTTVWLSVCLLSPSAGYSCCLEQANLNFWQFLLPFHDIIPAQSDCSPNQERRNIEQPNIENTETKTGLSVLLSLFAAAAFFRRIFLQICFVIFVYCFFSSSAVGSINWQTVCWKLKRCFGDQQRDGQRDHMVNSRPTRPLLRHWNRNHVLVKVGCPVQKSKSKRHNKCKSATNRGVKSHSHSHSESFQTIVSCGTHA